MSKADLLHRGRTQRGHRLKPQIEQLENRRLLAAEVVSQLDLPIDSTKQPNWYGRWDIEQAEQQAIDLGQTATEWSSQFIGPRRFVQSEWIVQLEPSALTEIKSVNQVSRQLDQSDLSFKVVAGLGLPGLVQVRSLALSDQAVEQSLSANSRVTAFSRNERVSSQAIPNDSDFGNMTSLHNVGQFGATVDADIDAPEAWDTAKGSTNVVVGIIDSGVDPTHPDLYLNIWLNQGEIPAALRSTLADTDADGLITFYDLNATANAGKARDLNTNGYIDARDLLEDPRWADGRDTDGNGFTDDFFGWNFRDASNETFAPNNPSDVLGHGTHVAGTIGAIGNNARGITGINWRSSLMSLKFLDETNQGDLASAISAINYATMMRTQFNTNIRVLNNSWGQPGSSNVLLKNSIEASGQAGILFVAAAGNGNILGQGVDNDKTQFYPASYELESVIAVGASDGADRLAGFSNYGIRSVDIVAPGVGVRSTLPGGRYGEANGTSMATPHVSGAAALVWSLQTQATVSEVRRALLEKGDSMAALGSQVSSGRRLNLQKSLNADVFAPTAELLNATNITTAGGTEQLITIKYQNRLGVDKASLGNSDVVVTRQAALDETFTTTFVSATENAPKTEVTAIYRLAAVGGTWDSQDYGNYSITAKADAARSLGGLASRESIVGSFQAKIAAAGIYYVDTLVDSVDVNPGDGLARDAQGRTSLRAAIMEANARAPQAIQIFMQTGTYALTIAPAIDPSVVYPVPGPGSGYDAPTGLQWSNSSTGDLDLKGNITLVGLGVNRTTIDAGGIDRVMKVYPGSTVSITGLTITGGNAPTNHSGGGILNSGNLSIARSSIVSNVADKGGSALGGGIASWKGSLTINSSVISNNQATGGGGVFTHDQSTTVIDGVTIANNRADGVGELHRHQVGGGGLFATENSSVNVTNSTFSENQVLGVGPGAAISKYRPALEDWPSIIDGPIISSDGRYISFGTTSQLLPADSNYTSDVYLYDRQTKEYELLSVTSDGIKANNSASPADVSRDGRYVAFRTLASNLDPSDQNGAWDLYWRDRLTGITKRVTVSSDGTGANDGSLAFGLSDDGKHVVFRSYASNLTADDNNGIEDVFVFNTETNQTERVSRGVVGTNPIGGGYGMAISGNGNYVAFSSSSGEFVADDVNEAPDVFLRNLLTDEVIRVSTSIAARSTPNGHSDLPDISSDGRFITFVSWSSDLVQNDLNQFPDIYLFDRDGKINELITMGWDGTPANGISDIPSISASGRYITFYSHASNLVPDDTDGVANYFVYDREARQMHRIKTADVAAPRSYTSISDGGILALVTGARLVPDDLLTYVDGYTVDISSKAFEKFTTSPYVYWGTGSGGWRSSVDKEWVGFTTLARLSSEDNNEIRDAYLWNSVTNEPILVSRGLGNASANGQSSSPNMDEKGQRVIFHSSASNLVPTDTNGVVDLFLFDRLDGTIRRIVENTSSSNIGSAELTADGLAVVFRSTSPNLVPGDNNGADDIFMYSIASGSTIRISTLADNSEANNASGLSSPNRTGEFVVFASAASNLVQGDLNNQVDIFVKNTRTGEIDRVSVGIGGTEAISGGISISDGTYKPSITSDGRFVTFKSNSPNLVSGDLNDSADLFAFDRVTRKTTRLSIGTNGNEEKGTYGAARISDDGRYAVFPSSTDFRGDGALSASTRLVVRDRILGTTDSFDFSYPMGALNAGAFNVANYSFVNNQTVFLVAGQTPGWYDLSTGAVQSIKRTDTTDLQNIVLNHITIIDDHQRFGSLVENLVSGDILIANSIVSTPQSQIPADAVSSGYVMHDGLPMFLNTWFPSQLELEASRLSDGSVVYSIPSGSAAQTAASKLLPVNYDQRGVPRVGLQELGAIEVVGGIVEGNLFVDSDGNGTFSTSDKGLEDQQLFVDYNFSGTRELDEPTVTTGETTTLSQGQGAFRIEDVRPGVFPIVPILKDGQVSKSSKFLDRIPLQKTTESIDLSADGSVVAFSSAETTHVAGDANGFLDVFTFDRISGQFTRVSNGLRGTEPNGDSYGTVVSSNGRFVAFLSNASNLVDDDTNGVTDVFVTNLSTRVTSRVNVASGGGQSRTAALGTIEISGDGNLVAFSAVSDAFTTGVALNPVVFVHDISANTTAQLTLIDEGLQLDESRGTQILNASFSDDFQAVAFTSSRSDLVTGDTNNVRDVFVLNRTTNSVTRASLGADGQESNGPSTYASISGNGSVVAFISNAGNMYIGDSTQRPELMLRRLSTNSTSRIGTPVSTLSPVHKPNLSFDGSKLAVRGYSGGEEVHGVTIFFLIDTVTNQLTEVGKSVGVSTSTANRGTSAVISGQGNHIAFTVPDTNRTFTPGTFVLDNRPSPGTFARISDGQTSNVSLAVSLASGEVSGSVFHDSIRNQVKDLGELGISGATVFLDFDSDGLLDSNEPRRTTDANGNYRFSNLEPLKEYSIRVDSVANSVQTTPAEGTAWKVFLEPGKSITDRDFGFVPASTGGQFENATLSGKLFNDLNGDGLQQSGEAGLTDVTVYLDLNANEVRDFNEPRTISDSSGNYTFSGLGNRAYTVRTLLPTGTIQTSPLGSKFATTSYTLTTGSTQLANPQDVIGEDFDGDGWTDLAVALFSGNSIAIRLNDKQGGFAGSPITVPIAPEGLGPMALASGKLNAGTTTDLISANQLNGTATILLDFNGTGFANKQTLAVGQTPTDIVLGKFDADTDVDAIVANKSTDQLTLLVNNGSGVFSKGASFSSGGKQPTAISTGLFNNDAFLDIAVANFGTHPTGGDFGNVAVLLGRGDGTFQTAVPYSVGFGPISLAADDFNGDGFQDLVTANFLSNTASLLLGSANGTFTVTAEQQATGQGPLQVQLQDIEGDGDKDILVTNLLSQTISVLRNRKSQAGTGFEPAENFGVAEFSTAPRLAFAAGDFDKSTTADIAIINSLSDSLKIMRNGLVDGAHRIQLTGVETVANLSFGTRPDVLLPTMNPITNPDAILEDAPEQSLALSGIAPGRSGGPALRITASSSNTAVIPTPIIDYVAAANSGQMRFTPAANQSGLVTLTVTTRDAGADKAMDTADDGVISRLVTVTIKPVNDPPTFNLSSRITSANEDSGAKSISGFITSITPGGGASEQSQTLGSFLVTADNLGLFAVQPKIDASGTLSFTPAANAVGSSIITVTLQDNGDTAYGGDNKKTDQFVLNITAINDQPAINIGGKQTIIVGSGPQSVANFATGFQPGGGADESTQKIADFVLTVDKPDLFSVLPSIDSLGTLRYTPSSTRTGLAKVNVQVRDDGGSSAGGTDLSVVQTLDIEVAPPPDTLPPSPVISSTTNSTTNLVPLPITVDFGEVVTGFTLSDLVVTGATASNLQDQGSGKYTLALQPASDGLVTLALPAGAAKDLSNNNSLATSLSRTVDTQLPSSTISTSEPNPTNRLSFPITIQFSEAVSDFDLSDLVVGNASASNLVAVSASQYTATITAASDGVVFVGFPANVAKDAASNGNSAPAPLVISINTGTSTFKPLITTQEATITGNRSFTALLDFGRVVNGFEAADLSLSNATATFTDLGTGKYQLNIQATNEGLVSIGLASNRVTDSGGRSNSAADTLQLTYVDVSNSDFGDAPSSAQSGFSTSYPTSLSSNGARHKIGSLKLGANADAELDGQPSATANADDASSNDEDGIIFPATIALSASAATQSSIVVLSTAAGFIDGWLDINRDGDWTDAGEQILNKVAVGAGRNLVSFALASSGSAGQSYARFRLSSVGGLSPTGPASDGEVEDYAVQLVAGSAKAIELKQAELGTHSISLDSSNNILVNVGQQTALKVPAVEIGTLAVQSSSGGRVLELGKLTSLPGKFTVPSATGELIKLEPTGSVNLSTIGASNLVGLQMLDLAAISGGQTVSFVLEDVSSLNTDRKLRILLDIQDSVSTPSGVWRSTTGRTESGQWIQPMTSGNTTVEVVSQRAWTNQLMKLDVNGDAKLTPADALQIINVLNDASSPLKGTLPARSTTLPQAFFDTTADNRITPSDALAIINALNARPSGEGEASHPLDGHLVDAAIFTDPNLDDLFGNRKRFTR